jgi:hypothetical protein
MVPKKKAGDRSTGKRTDSSAKAKAHSSKEKKEKEKSPIPTEDDVKIEYCPSDSA